MMPCGESTCHSCSGGADEGEGEGEGEQDDSPVQPNNSQKGQRKRKKADVGWREEPQGGLVVTKRAGELLSELLTVYNRANREHLDVLLAGLDPASLSMESGSSLATVVNRLVCAAEDDVSEVVKVLVKQDVELRLKELHRMVTLVQLALHVDSLRADAVLKHCTPPTYESLAKQYAGTTPTGMFRDWLSHGKCLLLLCAAGSCYILPIIAVLDLRTVFTRKTTLEPDIRSLATALREVKHGLWLPMVRRLMVPMYHMNTSPGQLKSLEFVYNVPKPQGQSLERLSFGFLDIETSERLFDSVETQFPQLPTRSKEWDFRNLPLWKPLQNPQLVVLPPVHTIRTPLQYQRNRCPVTKANRNTFTDAQRGFAEQAEVAEDLEDLKAKMTNIHATGVTQPGSYVEVNSDILEGNALRIEDNNRKLLSFLFQVPQEYRQLLVEATHRIHTCMPGEFKDEDSRCEFFKYLSCHYSWYARYTENGKTAPKGIHPDKLCKNHKGRVNLEQWNPHPSKEMQEHSAEWAMLAEAYTDFFELLRLKEYLPEDYNELSIYVESLPLNASSPAYPFGGFVINISACTWAHRDKGDKHLCLVVPSGDFEGGQLCLYEAGLSFNLKLGDVLIFPSCDLTHFNLHFRRTRGIIVLHSDCQGDSWVRNAHGWSAVLRHTA